MKDSNDEMDAKRQVGVAAPTKPAVRRRKSSVMRKSLALGTIAAAGLTVAACDDAPSDQVFKSISDCKTSGFSAFVCEKEFTEARARHAKTAPKFKTSDECEQKFGNSKCMVHSVSTTNGTTQGTSNFYTPLLTGFLVSQALHRIRTPYAYYSYRSNYPGYYSTPIYRDRGGRTVTSVRSGTGTKARTVTRPVNVNTRTVARRGFGGRSYSSRGWGG
ncbi:MAG: hypothetical protein ACI89J_003994 [Hyphomicrobiaceae bacterium]|jgi:uncharacterized protein YgiB involved in biofilm formation